MKINNASFNQYRIQKLNKDSGGSGKQSQQQNKEQQKKQKLQKRQDSKSSASIFASLNSAELVITPKIDAKDRILELSKTCSLENVQRLTKILATGTDENNFNVLKTFLMFVQSSNEAPIINAIFESITPHSDHADIRIRLLIVMIFKEIRLKRLR